MSLPAKPLRILLLGAPGSGKGTQTSRLLKHFPGLQSISSGDLLRREIATESPIGVQVREAMSQGLLIDDQVVTDLVAQRLQGLGLLNNKSSFLLDGFPRTLNQAVLLTNKLTTYNTGLNMVVELKVPKSVILERIENRWVHLPSGRIYNTQYNPPIKPGFDDVTGEPLTKRPDDNVETFKERLNQYNETIRPVKEFYKSFGILHTVQGPTSDIIFPQLLKLVQEHEASA